ncbi:hypothetical protein K438DRAFT_1967597 [Mycena galopus ATCC 62051]|nr:hypothetical protein K438DRAFT_1967597 [Mycena galopus ATCC 62051]
MHRYHLPLPTLPSSSLVLGGLVLPTLTSFPILPYSHARSLMSTPRVITPVLFQAYPSMPGGWALATLMRTDGTLEATMEAHYDTFIVPRLARFLLPLHFSFTLQRA